MTGQRTGPIVVAPAYAGVSRLHRTIRSSQTLHTMFNHRFISMGRQLPPRRSGSMVAVLVALVAGLLTTMALATAASAKASIRVTMKGQNHHPVVNKRWTYSVTVTSARGRRLSGTETTHYLYGSTVVGTEKPINVRFKNGYYHDTIEFPGAAVGHPLRVWVVVKTRYGSGSAAWWIIVKR
jgi:hypothetical protein